MGSRPCRRAPRALAKRPGRRGIKRHRNYTVDEAANAIRVAKGTVLRWIKAGLPALQDRRPFLILGADLIDFLDGKTAVKRTCQIQECFCFTCRAPREAAGGMADVHLHPGTGGNMRALCSECLGVMHKRLSAPQIEALRSLLEVTIRQAPAHISERADPCLNDHLHKEG